MVSWEAMKTVLGGLPRKDQEGTYEDYDDADAADRVSVSGLSIRSSREYAPLGTREGAGAALRAAVAAMQPSELETVERRKEILARAAAGPDLCAESSSASDQAFLREHLQKGEKQTSTPSGYTAKKDLPPAPPRAPAPANLDASPSSRSTGKSQDPGGGSSSSRRITPRLLEERSETSKAKSSTTRSSSNSKPRASGASNTDSNNNSNSKLRSNSSSGKPSKSKDQQKEGSGLVDRSLFKWDSTHLS
eukprot:TRINITY_DN1345_c2_g1_i1.p1 TRINITY_DN1345_c2_g1~~TRINITY_DN1345_c2_g1_i1.p1  ORF type:complete len:248 (+),score=57.33 TRINITY_DN1345_c2_g1_i1:78-821(+)